MYPAMFNEQQPNCSFVLYQVRCAHISGDADNFITVYAEFLHDYNDIKIIKIG